MGAKQSTTLLDTTERDTLTLLTGSESFPFDNDIYNTLAFREPLTRVNQADLHLQTRNYCDRMARNNASTRNLNTLLGHVLHRLGRVDDMEEPEVLSTVNTIFLARTFLKFLIDVGDPAVLVAQLNAGITHGVSMTNIPAVDTFNARTFVLGLVDFLSSNNVTAETYDVHLEALNTLTVMFSSQLRATELPPPPGFGGFAGEASTAGSAVGGGTGAGAGAGAGAAHPTGADPFLEYVMFAGEETSSVQLTSSTTTSGNADGPATAGAPTPSFKKRCNRFVGALLKNFVRRIDAPLATAAAHEQLKSQASAERALASSAAASGAAAGAGTSATGSTAAAAGATAEAGVLGVVSTAATTAASTIIFLPYQLYTYLFPHKPKSYPVADRSALLLLLLSHNCRSRGWRNPYRQEICTVSDMDGDASLSTPHSIRVRMSDLYSSLCLTACTPSGTVLLYTFFHGNPMFMNFLLARTDLDRLLLPLLEQLYDAATLQPFQRYILLIVFLLFTQDAGFCDNVHQRVSIKDVPWFTDRIITDIKLGSLILVMLLRTVQFNLTKLQDGYMHTTSFAALANMSPHCQDLHPYAAQRMVGVMFVLIRKYERISGRLAASRRGLVPVVPAGTTAAPSASSSPPEDETALSAALDQYSQLLHILLEIIHACLAPRVLRHNLHLVYHLMHRRSILEPLQTDSRFASLVDGVNQVLSHFDGIIRRENDKGGVMAEEDILALLTANCQSWRGGADAAAQAASLADTKFTYDEEACPDDFFVPYVWSLTIAETRDLQWDPRVIHLFPLSDAGLDDNPSSGTSRGTPSPTETDASARSSASVDATAPVLPTASGHTPKDDAGSVTSAPPIAADV